MHHPLFIEHCEQGHHAPAPLLVETAEYSIEQTPSPLPRPLQESSKYHDVVAADFVDSYRNLTLKMMVGLKWVSRFCPHSRFVLKCDLDTFVNLPLLTRILPSIR